MVPHGNERLHPQAKEGERYGMPSNYQEKYRKLLGGLDCAEKSAVKMQPNKSFGYGELCHAMSCSCIVAYTVEASLMQRVSLIN